MAARKPKAPKAAEPLEDALEPSDEGLEEVVTYGPYELVDGVNSLSFGGDPLIEISAGERFMTTEIAVAMFLDECEHVRRADA